MLSINRLPAQAATNGEIDQAIQDGLSYLSTQQNADGGWYLGYNMANTAAALMAFENEGHFPGGGSTYSTVVEKGLNHMFLYCNTLNINNQTVGYPGGIALYLYIGREGGQPSMGLPDTHPFPWSHPVLPCPWCPSSRCTPSGCFEDSPPGHPRRERRRSYSDSCPR
ncbi:MAG: hypothetical protein HW388_1541 [Dehalococcoidia bacterium]|nr:hypothetical protein [Dehalococcoidia bacterium]